MSIPLQLRHHPAAMFAICVAAVSSAAAATRFASDTGFAPVVLTQHSQAPINALPLQDGGALIAGGFNRANGQSVGKIIRVDAAGSLISADFASSLSSVGTYFLSFKPPWAQLGDGTFLISLPARDPQPARIDHVNLFGIVDLGTSLEVVSTDPSHGPGIASMTSLPDGRIVVAGSFTAIGGHASQDVAVIDSTGAVSLAFIARTHFSGPIAIGVDGAVVGVSPAPSNPASPVWLPPNLVRLDAAGAVSNTWTLPPADVGPLAVDRNGDVLVTLMPMAPIVFPYEAPPVGSFLTQKHTLGMSPTEGMVTVASLYRFHPGTANGTLVASSADFSSISEIECLADGGIVLVGKSWNSSWNQSSGLQHLNEDGTVGAAYVSPTLAGKRIVDLQRLPDGWLAVLDSGGLYNDEILRKLDSSFVLRSDFGPDLRLGTPPGAAYALPDGSMLLQGSFASGAGTFQGFVRLRSDGSLDFEHVPHVPNTTFEKVAAIGPDGSIYLTAAPVYSPIVPAFPNFAKTDANAILPVSPTTDTLAPAEVERLSIDGIPDLGFGRVSLGGIGQAITSVVADSTGGILLVGGRSFVGLSIPAAERLQPSGAPDPSFVLAAGPVPLGILVSAARRPGGFDGYLLLDATGRLAAVHDRGNAAGTEAGYRPYESGFRGLASAAGNVYARGDFIAASNNNSPGLTRLLPDGSPDFSWTPELMPGSEVTGIDDLLDGRLLVHGNLQLDSASHANDLILTAEGAIDRNEALPSFEMTAADATGRIYIFKRDGSVQRLHSVSRLAAEISVGAASYVPGDPIHLVVKPATTVTGKYVWLHNGAAVDGTDSDTLDIASAKLSDAGWYTAQVPTSEGLVYASIHVQIAETGARISNASVRSLIRPEGAVQTMGFFLGGTSAQPAILREVGPALRQFGVANPADGTLSELYLALFGFRDGPPISPFCPYYSGHESRSNALLLSGAFAITDPASNPCWLLSPAPGTAYTSERGNAFQSGVGLSELYLPEPPGTITSGRRILNFSGRALAGVGDQVLIVGFVVEGTRPLPVLIRAVGPGLRFFGVSGSLNAADLLVYSGQSQIASNSGWVNQSGAAQVAAVASRVLAFPLDPLLADSALVLTLQPGAYTAILSTRGQTGQGMIEIYDASG